MNCCPNCFKNRELQAIIGSISTEKGDCDFCGSKETIVVDSREMAESFAQPVGLYRISKDVKNTMSELMQEEWDIFNLDSKRASDLLKCIFSDESTVDPNLFTKDVINYAKHSPESKEIVDRWNNLRNEIITKNRFFIEHAFEHDLLEKLLVEKKKKYTTGTLFYRGRISDKDGFDRDKIGKPPAKKATSGRANPKGIPYLYLSSDLETTLYETRATYLDFVTIGTFELTDDIEIVKLRTVDITNPFEENLFERIVNQPFLKKLESELSRPLRRHDSDLEYLPTQYLCEFIKYIGFEGVEYGSAMRKGGINVAFFDDAKFRCTKTQIVEVENIEISTAF